MKQPIWLGGYIAMQIGQLLKLSQSKVVKNNLKHNLGTTYDTNENSKEKNTEELEFPLLSCTTFYNIR